MKNILVIIITVIGCVQMTNAQEKSQQIISSAGEISTIGNISLEWTLGEPVNETSSAGSLMFTQGFHQSLLIFRKELVTINTDEIAISLSPNPVTSILTVRSKFSTTKKYTVSLLNLEGNILYSGLMLPQQNIRINMMKYAAGQYIIRILGANGKLISSYRVIKL